LLDFYWFWPDKGGSSPSGCASYYHQKTETGVWWWPFWTCANLRK